MITAQEKLDIANNDYIKNKEKYEQLNKILHNKYANVNIAKEMLGFMESGRAKNIDEAAKLYDIITAERKEKMDDVKEKAFKIGLGAILSIVVTTTSACFFTIFMGVRKK